jgi:hypothetical protein
MDKEQIEQLQSFLSTARGHHGASSGEQAAFKLVKMASEISHLMMSLDQDRQEGFLQLLRGLAWPNTREMLLEQIARRAGARP